MKLFLILVLFLQSASAIEIKNFNISGSTRYSESSRLKGEDRTLYTTIAIEYKFILHESKNKKWILHLSGNLNPDYDHFGNEIKINSFTAFGVDF